MTTLLTAAKETNVSLVVKKNTSFVVFKKTRVIMLHTFACKTKKQVTKVNDKSKILAFATLSC